MNVRFEKWTVAQVIAGLQTLPPDFLFDVRLNEDFNPALDTVQIALPPVPLMKLSDRGGRHNPDLEQTEKAYAAGGST